MHSNRPRNVGPLTGIKPNGPATGTYPTGPAKGTSPNGQVQAHAPGQKRRRTLKEGQLGQTHGQEAWGVVNGSSSEVRRR